MLSISVKYLSCSFTSDIKSQVQYLNVKINLISNLCAQFSFKTYNSRCYFQIFFHGNKMKSFHEHIPPSVLPKNYDGDLPPINYSGKDWWPAVESAHEHMKKWSSFGLVKKK